MDYVSSSCLLSDNFDLTELETFLNAEAPLLVHESYESYNHSSDSKYESKPNASATTLINYLLHIPELELEKSKKKRKRRPEPMTDICRVCSDIAPPHNHYGAIACFSCRAFFGRTVHKGTQDRFRCVRGNPKDLGKCTMTKTSRTICQYCRYQGCIASGMRQAYVTSAEERQNKKASKKSAQVEMEPKLNLQMKYFHQISYFPSARLITKLSISLHNSQTVPQIHFMIEVNNQLDIFFESKHRTWRALSIGMSIVKELIRVESSSGNDIEIKMSIQSIKTKAFSSFMSPIIIPSFSTNIPNSKRLLNQNNEQVLILRITLDFSNIWKEQLIDFMKSQDIVQCRPNESTNGQESSSKSLISVSQKFNNPWTIHSEPLIKYLIKMEKMNLENRTQVYLCLLPLFAGCDSNSETRLLSDLQEQMNTLLFLCVTKTYTSSRIGYIYSKIMEIVVNFQEIVTLTRVSSMSIKLFV